jgi:hypothetical protein
MKKQDDQNRGGAFRAARAGLKPSATGESVIIYVALF